MVCLIWLRDKSLTALKKIATWAAFSGTNIEDDEQ